MQQRFEKTLQQDIDEIRKKVMQMGDLVESALKASLQAIREGNLKLAYSVILRDRFIDELEKKLDRLCQKFLVRQMPAAGHLRFVYAVTKINNELERVGDYAESVARQFLELNSLEEQPAYDKLVEIGNLSIPMFKNALQSFVDQNAELAKSTKKLEEKVDNTRYEIHHELVQLREQDKLPSEALPPMMIIASRFERVADQACNICEEVLFMTTGENVKHGGDKNITRILFVDERDSCRARMALGITESLGWKKFQFSSAGISPEPVDPKTVKFMTGKGIDIPQKASQHLNQISDLENYQVIISLCKEAEVAFPSPPTKTVSIPWHIEDPSEFKGSDKEVQAVYEKTFQYIEKNIRDLVEAIRGNGKKKGG